MIPGLDFESTSPDLDKILHKKKVRVVSSFYSDICFVTQAIKSMKLVILSLFILFSNISSSVFYQI